jgi:hypothetical protein
MSRIIGRVAKLALGITVGIVLSFGAGELQAASNSLCEYNPSQGKLGYCEDQAHCEFMCREYYGGWPYGLCNPEHCCICII